MDASALVAQAKARKRKPPAPPPRSAKPQATPAARPAVATSALAQQKQQRHIAMATAVERVAVPPHDGKTAGAASGEAEFAAKAVDTGGVYLSRGILFAAGALGHGIKAAGGAAARALERERERERERGRLREQAAASGPAVRAAPVVATVDVAKCTEAPVAPATCTATTATVVGVPVDPSVPPSAPGAAPKWWRPQEKTVEPRTQRRLERAAELSGSAKTLSEKAVATTGEVVKAGASKLSSAL